MAKARCRSGPCPFKTPGKSSASRGVGDSPLLAFSPGTVNQALGVDQGLSASHWVPKLSLWGCKGAERRSEDVAVRKRLQLLPPPGARATGAARRT